MAKILDKLVYIEWWDHCSSDSVGWKSRASLLEINNPSLVKSVGWVLQETDTFIQIVSSAAATDVDDDTYDGDVLIAKPCIKYMQTF